MRYEKVQMATFLARPNRFVALCLMFDGSIQESHVPNTGRCRELLVPGCRVFLQFHDNPRRKTRHTIIAVEKNGILINMDSQAPNRVVEEALQDGSLLLTKEAPTLIRREAPYDQSRLDFYLEAPGERVYAEVKGVTLEENGVVRFPDAPTQRGLRHIRELIRAVGEGFGAAVIFVVQMDDAQYFAPNDDTQPEFGRALKEARDAGVRLVARCCDVTPLRITLGKEIPIQLK
jgi:sugar fermentation stimulation protein